MSSILLLNISIGSIGEPWILFLQTKSVNLLMSYSKVSVILSSNEQVAPSLNKIFSLIQG